MRRTQHGRGTGSVLHPVLHNTYAALEGDFHTRLPPTRAQSPALLAWNAPLAAELGLDGTSADPRFLAEVFSGNRLLEGSEPIATVYAGHQFGQFVPLHGDGRAILLGEVRDRHGTLRDVQLKGAGRTPYSRNGDGRAALGPVLREYLVSEAMHALGIPTTRSLAVVATGDAVFRERRLPGAVLTRIASSHIRVGTFQFFAGRGDVESTRRLADYVIARHFPEVGPCAEPYLDLLRAVTLRQARLVSRWMGVGFIHGVMNTDNMSICGESLDFGPCAFMDAYGAATVFSSIDSMGRYAYANQPAAAQWNLARFAETLLPLIDAVPDNAVRAATAVVVGFVRDFESEWLGEMRRKLGLFTEEDGDADLIRRLLAAMEKGRADFTLTFRRLCAAAESEAGDAAAAACFEDAAPYREWSQIWRARLAHEPQPGSEHAAFMRLVNPAVIPRNHRIEAVIDAAVERGDLAPFEELHAVLARPFSEPAVAGYADPPRADERVLQTFCGT